MKPGAVECQELWDAESADPVDEMAGTMRVTDPGARSLRATWLSLPGAAFAGERR
jgi:hypothetical protein